MKKIALIVLGITALALHSQAASIAWISFHSGDNTPSAGAAGAGMTTASDVGYTTLLGISGHTVTRYLTLNEPTATEAAAYNAHDLVIVSRGIASGNFDSATESAFWSTSVTKPVLHLGGYHLRDNRLGYTTGNTIPDTAGSIALQALVPAHPVFSGIALDGLNVMVNSFAGIATFNATLQRGISVNTDPLDGGGTLIAKIATAGDPANTGTGMIIAEWAAGSVLEGNAQAAKRLVFLTGSREAAGINSETAGIFDLTSDGSLMFLNAVNYLVPEPSTYALLGLGALALIFRWRKS